VAESPTRVFLDANILWPVSLVDLTFRLAEVGYHEIVWTEDLLRELARVLVDYKGLPIENAQRFCQQIRDTFPEGEIPRESYEKRIEHQLGPDKDDHAHSAAAAEGGATILLTANVLDFPDGDVTPCVVREPDDYYCAVLDDDQELVELTLQRMSAHLTRPPVSVDQLIDALQTAGCPRFAERLRVMRAGGNP